jgi:hypothetical protein
MAIEASFSFICELEPRALPMKIGMLYQLSYGI